MAARKKTTTKAPALPKTIGSAADALYTLRESRLKLEKSVETMKRDEKTRREHVLGLLKDAGLESGRGKVATVSRVGKVAATISDWDAFTAFLRKGKNWDLIQKRVGMTAAKERWDEGKVIPGVTKQTFNDVSVTKASRG